MSEAEKKIIDILAEKATRVGEQEQQLVLAYAAGLAGAGWPSRRFSFCQPLAALLSVVAQPRTIAASSSDVNRSTLSIFARSSAVQQPNRSLPRSVVSLMPMRRDSSTRE